jgi:hypothetical protein
MFDYTAAMGQLVRHVVEISPDFAHVQLDYVLISYIQTRTPGAHGVFASLQPLRFEDGQVIKRYRGRNYVMPSFVRDGREMLYIIYFALPRFIDLPFEEKLETVFHELYHISPQFNGDIRRFPGKNFAHGYSRKRYNERINVMASAYLAEYSSDERLAFLHLNYDELTREHGGIIGTRIRPPRPKLV